MRAENVPGGYGYLSSTLGFASGGVVALPGMAIERAVLDGPQPLAAGFEAAGRYLERIERPPSALCGFDLRIPRSLSAAEFERFNDRYLSRLAGWGLVPAAGSPPPARTNVAPAGTELTEPAVAGFSYTRPYAQQSPTSSFFVISGVPELPEHFSYPGDIVRRGETSPDALADKARCVIDVIAARIKELGLAWTESARVHLYSLHDMAGVVREQLLTRVGVAPLYGITWHHAAPPIDELELEIDVRRYAAELTPPAR